MPNGEAHVKRTSKGLGQQKKKFFPWTSAPGFPVGRNEMRMEKAPNTIKFAHDNNLYMQGHGDEGYFL